MNLLNCINLEIMKELENKYYSMFLDYSEPKEAIKIEIKKFNKYNQLCYFDSKDFTDEQINLITNLFSSAGFVTEIRRHTYFGIYDPSQTAELIEIYPTDEQLLQTEIREEKKWFKV